MRIVFLKKVETKVLLTPLPKILPRAAAVVAYGRTKVGDDFL